MPTWRRQPRLRHLFVKYIQGAKFYDMQLGNQIEIAKRGEVIEVFSVSEVANQRVHVGNQGKYFLLSVHFHPAYTQSKYAPCDILNKSAKQINRLY